MLKNNYEKDILTEYYREDMQRPIHFNKQGDKIIFRKKRFLESGERIRNNHAFGIINLNKDLDDETVIELEDKYIYNDEFFNRMSFVNNQNLY